MNMLFERQLAIPMEVKEMYPLTGNLNEIVEKRNAALKAIFDGRSDKFLLIIGPCSADNEDSVVEYVNRLRALADKVSDKLFIVPRVYTNKPRTTGDGYKGMLHQPNPGEKPDMFKGIIAIRELHMRVLRETGMAAADEMLYPENYKYLDDMLGYVAVGARSVENQQHRLTASGIEVPVGMKNPTSGDLQVMLNAIHAAQRGHTFIYRGWEVRSQGNPYAHAILRGYVNKHGQSQPNYHYEDLVLIDEFYHERTLENPAVVVDVNHSNSDKKYAEQIRIAREVMHSRRYNDSIRRLVKGLMIESYLVDGAQKVDGGVYGQSITDPCLGWEKTERLVLDLAEMA
ncbi:MAG: 3-deoxy-7-phosphoheptulonate synthase [Clostridia bacterium]|nr:3-deoxy-7-phosphoheptulonate synthase [Clostridia bacterium]MBR4443457.1 3-deoxy-7-phosphoheptulonate synthase [Clostridia bacterium]